MIILSCLPFILEGFTYVSGVFLLSYVFGIVFKLFGGARR